MSYRSVLDTRYSNEFLIEFNEERVEESLFVLLGDGARKLFVLCEFRRKRGLNATHNYILWVL